MPRFVLFVVAIVAFGVFLLSPHLAFGLTGDQAWAPDLQKIVARDILEGDMEQLYGAMYIAGGLGPSRMTEEVRSALITRLEALNKEQDIALEAGIPTNEVVNGEFFLDFVGLIASLRDTRAIPGLIHGAAHAYNRSVVHELAAFGETALPQLLQAVRDPRTDDFALSTQLGAISLMVQDGGAERLSTPAREEVLRLARSSLHSKNATFVVHGVDIAKGLDDAELNLEIELLAHDRGLLSERGFSDFWVGQIRESAIEALKQSQQGN